MHEAGATNVAHAGTGAMHDTRAQQFGAIVGDQEGGKSKEEQAREEIKQKLDEIYERSKQKVDDKLKEVDTQVNAEFERGLAAAISAYQTYTEAEVGSTLNFLTVNLFDWTSSRIGSTGKGNGAGRR